MIFMVLDLAFLMSEQTLLPFLFVLAIIFGFLNLLNIFGKNVAVNFLIALSIAFFTISNASFVSMLWSSFGGITTFFIVMFLLAFVFEVFGLRKREKIESTSSIVVNGAILFILLSVGFLYVNYIPETPFVGSGQNLLLLLAIIFVLAIFWSAFKIGGPKKVYVKGG